MNSPCDQRVNIKINELDASKTLDGLYNYATEVDDYEPLYCFASDGSQSLNMVEDMYHNLIYVVKN